MKAYWRRSSFHLTLNFLTSFLSPPTSCCSWLLSPSSSSAVCPPLSTGSTGASCLFLLPMLLLLLHHQEYPQQRGPIPLDRFQVSTFVIWLCLAVVSFFCLLWQCSSPPPPTGVPSNKEVPFPRTPPSPSGS